MTKRRSPQIFCAIRGISCGRRPAQAASAVEQRPAVDPADQRVDQVLRVRHQAEHVEPAVEDAGDVVLRSVRIGGLVDAAGGVAIAEGDLARAFDRLECRVVGFEVALAVGDREFHHLSLGIAAGERRRRRSRPSGAASCTGSDGWRCASGRPAAGPPRTGSGSRCRCRAPGRRARRDAATARMIGDRAAIAPQRR